MIFLPFFQISEGWSELDTTVVRGPGFYGCTLDISHAVFSDFLPLIGLGVAYGINFVPFFMGVFANTMVGRACLPYRINDAE